MKKYQLNLILIFLVLLFLPSCATKTGRNADEAIHGFIEAFSTGDLEQAKSYLANPEYPLTTPQNRLGEVIRKSLKVTEIKVNESDGTSDSADVMLEMVDVLQIMSRATMLYLIDTRSTPGEIDANAAQEDERMDLIYDSILQEREDDPLPTKNILCIIPLLENNGSMEIVMDENLEAFLNGSLSSHADSINRILENTQDTPDDTKP